MMNIICETNSGWERNWFLYDDPKCREHMYDRLINEKMREKRWLGMVWFMVFNTTFNNISGISSWSVLLVEESGEHRENHRPVASDWQILSHNVISSSPCLSGVRTHNVSGDRHW